MAYIMNKAGFEVIDIHMTDLMSGKETLMICFLLQLEDSQFIVLGSAKDGRSFIYNENARNSLKNSSQRRHFLGVCNGCQLFMELV